MPHLSIRALGPLVVTLDDQPITALAYNKVWALLVYLAHATEHPHRRESLAALLWPDQPEENARQNLRQALARLRQTIDDPHATPPFLLIERTTIQFNAASDFTLDASQFTALLAACASHTHRHIERCAVCAKWREEAVALYPGAFLDKFYIGDSDLFEEWTTLVREPLHQQAMEAMAALVAYHEWQGNDTQALRYSERQLELDPWREEAYRQSMRLLARNGQRSAALQHYARCRTILNAEFGVEPSAETQALYDQICADEVDVALPTDSTVRSTAGSTVGVTGRSTVRRHNLPLQPTPFIGREQELATLADMLVNPQCRLITLVGPGGTGKTRLAIQAASDMANHAQMAFADGTTFVSLAPLNAAEFVVPTIAAALNVTLNNHAAPETELLRYLRQQELLLVLDNFEHLLAPPAQNSDGNSHDNSIALLRGILQQAPGVKLLVTSRERLNVQGEWLFDVGGLATPTQHLRADAGGRAEFEASPAVMLFVQTAQRVLHGFVPTDAEQAAIMRICQLVQGMPLALELAATWVRVLSCHKIADEIAQSLNFLTTTLRDLPARHRSLQAVFDHSWQLLSAEEQRVFAACSVFRGGFTHEAAAAVADASLPCLAALVDKSLLRPPVDDRYEIHELARQYAAAQLADAHEETATRHRHLAFFMHFAERAEPHIRGGAQIAQWHEWVEIEHDNLRAALEWSLHSDAFEPGLRIAAALWEFWMNRGHAPEGQRQAERFLARPEVADYPVLRALVMHTAGVCAFYHGRFSTALVWFGEAAAQGLELGEAGRYARAIALVGLAYTRISLNQFDEIAVLSQEALQLGEALQISWIQGDALNQLARLAWHRGDIATASQHFRDALQAAQVDDTRIERGYVMQGFGRMLTQQGDYATARQYLQQSLAIFEEIGDKIRHGNILTYLGHLAIAQDHVRDAQQYFTQALLLLRDTSHVDNRINPLDALGRLAQREGDFARARRLHQESLDLSIEMERTAWTTHVVEAFASLAARQGEAAVAARLFGATATHPLPLKFQVNKAWQLEHDQLVATLRAQLGEAAFAAAWGEGANMTLGEAIVLVKGQWYM